MSENVASLLTLQIIQAHVHFVTRQPCSFCHQTTVHQTTVHCSLVHCSVHFDTRLPHSFHHWTAAFISLQVYPVHFVKRLPHSFLQQSSAFILSLHYLTPDFCIHVITRLSRFRKSISQILVCHHSLTKVNIESKLKNQFFFQCS